MRDVDKSKDELINELVSLRQELEFHKQSETSNKLRSDKAQSVVNTMPHHIYRIDLDGRLTFVNESLLESLGVPLEDILGKTAYDFYPQELAEQYRKDDRQVIESGVMLTQVEENVSPQTHVRSYVEVIKVPTYDADGKVNGIQGIFHDVTERKRTEASLSTAFDEMSRLFHQLPVGIQVFNADGLCIDVNKAHLDIFGVEHDDLVGKYNIFADTHAEAMSTQQAARRALAGETALLGDLEFVFQNADPRYASITQEPRMVNVVLVPMFDSDQNVTHIIGVNVDVTERKQTELAILEHERLKSNFQKEQEKNELFQRMVSALSHDLRTPLTVISTSKDLLVRYYDRMSIEKRQQKFDMIQHQIQYMLELLDDLVTLVRGNLSDRRFKPIPLHLDRLCQVSISELNSTQPQRRAINFVNHGNVGLVAVDEVLVSRILVNLLSNAVKYSPEGGEIRLELNYKDEGILLCVSDQGHGMDEDELSHIFEPFYRAAKAKRVPGTGLGLSIVYDCVERHQGKISVRSQVGRGSSFEIWLPLIKIPASASAAH